MIEKLAKFRIFATLFILAGCGTTPPPVVQRVEVPVYAECVLVMPKRPEFAFDKLKVSDLSGAKVLALVEDVPRWLKYEGELLAVIEGCK